MTREGGEFGLATVVGLSCLIGMPFGALAGDLEPPGSPAPTMKPLDHVEPRVPIRGTDLPLNIDTPGSYYLVENIETSSGGITIATDGVTIDLMGFTLRGGTGDGIAASCCARERVVVRDGTVVGWTGDGIDFLNAIGARVVDVAANGNTARGVILGNQGMLTRCSAHGNGGHGVRALRDGRRRLGRRRQRG